MNRDDLMRRIQALSFAKVEAELFLDTHPECLAALDYYHSVAEELDAAVAEYQESYGPIRAEGSARDRWSWADSPWPWQQMGEGRMKDGKTMKEGGKG